MKDFQSILAHPKLSEATALSAESGSPIVATVKGQQQKVGKPLSTEQVLKLLKATLRQDTYAQLTLGATVTQVISTAEQHFTLEAKFQSSEEVSVSIQQVELHDEEGEPVEESPPSAEPLHYPEVDPDVVDELTRGVEKLALLYSPGEAPKALSQFFKKEGYTVKQSEHAGSVLEVVSYYESPIVVLALDDSFGDDIVYRAISEMLMEVRRNKFIVLVAPGLDGKDAITAYSLSMNLVWDSEQLATFPEFFHEAFQRWDRGTALYRECLTAE